MPLLIASPAKAQSLLPKSLLEALKAHGHPVVRGGLVVMARHTRALLLDARASIAAAPAVARLLAAELGRDAAWGLIRRVCS